MPERSFSSILDSFRKKGGKPETAGLPKPKPDKPDSAVAKEPAKSETVLTDEENTCLKGYLITAKAKETSGDIKAALELYTKYKQEFLAIKNRGKSMETLSPEYLEALSKVFKGETLDNIPMPKPEELTEEYFDKMYPVTQREEDTARGLVSFRPSWWNNAADSSIVGSAKETWGQAFVRSMKKEAEGFKKMSLFTESIQKPKHIDGSQQYGTKEGTDATQDPLLPIIQEVFGDKANRFNLTWDQITNKLLPKVKEKITVAFTSKGLSAPDFEVILTPALVSNQQMTNLRSENSQTTTWEWSSTPLLKQDNTDTGRRLFVGDSGLGGAGCVDDNPRGHSGDGRGFRLSVVFAEKH